MTSRRTHVVNYVLYQTGWFAAVGGAAVGASAAGAAIAFALTGAHVLLARERAREATLVGAAFVTGLVVERLLIGAGTYRLFAGTPADTWPPLWLVALWTQFATTWRYSLAAVFARWWTAALFGALGGPLAFAAGARLGAVVLAMPAPPALLRLGVAWAVALVLLSRATRAIGGGTPGAYRG